MELPVQSYQHIVASHKKELTKVVIEILVSLIMALLSLHFKRTVETSLLDINMRHLDKLTSLYFANVLEESELCF